MTIGKQLHDARQKAGLTQAQLAEKVGVATITIRQYEAGKRQPGITMLKEIASALNTSPSVLLGIQTFSNGVEFDAAWKSLEAKNTEYGLTNVYTTDLRGFINRALDCLNDEGQRKAAERVGELTEIPRYCKEQQSDGEEPLDENL